MTDDERTDEDRDALADRAEERPRRREPRPNKSSRTLWYVLGGAGCLLVLICGGGVALIVWGVNAFTKDLPAVQSTVDSFFDALKADKLDDAYATCSTGYQRQTSREQFAAFVKQYGAFQRHQTRSMNGFNIFSGTAGKQARIQQTLHEPNNAMTCTLILVVENGTWKVDKVTVP